MHFNMFSEALLAGWLKHISVFCLNHPGILIVVISVGVEVVCDWNKKKSLKERIKKLAGIALVFGLSVEIWEAVKSDKEVSNAMLAAGKANELAANTESNNLVLRSNVAALEAAVQWRTISPTQEDILISQLKPFAQANFMAIKTVQVGTAMDLDFEANWYAKMITRVLIKCGFDAKMEAPGIGLGDPSNLTGSPIGLDITENGYQPTPSMIAITQAFMAAEIKVRFAMMLTDSVPDGIVHIKVWHKPEK